MIRFLLPASCISILALAGLATALAVEVPSTKPERGTIHRWITLPASFVPWQQVELRARVSGYVKSVAVDSGDAVTIGQPLIEIEVPELQADLIRHEAEVTAATAAAKRLQEAFAKAPDLVLPQDVDDAEARLAIATAHRDRAQTLLDFAQIKAPFAGTITARFADPGAFASVGGAALLHLADCSTLRLQVPVVELESGLVRLGQPVEAKVEALGNAVLRGTVSRISGALDPATRTMRIEADFPNSDGRLRPGMFASVRIGVERHDGAMLIPAAGLIKEKSGTSVFLHADGKALKVPVKIGFADGVSVEVPELEPDQVILLPGATPLTSGQEVTVK